jgi:hypothetical protein
MGFGYVKISISAGPFKLTFEVAVFPDNLPS